MTSYQVAEWLRKGIAAAQAGDTQRAYELLLKVVDIDEYNEQAWLWLSSVVETDADREVCLENVLAINADNKLAKAGLVHLRNKAAQPPPPPAESEPPKPPELESAAPAAQATTDVAGTDWWDQPQTAEPAAERDDSWVDDLLTSSAQAQIDAAWAQPQPRRAWRRPRVSLRRLAIAVLFLLGLLAASVAVIAFMQLGIFDPTKRAYADAMEPLLAKYDAWWEGPQGALVKELSSFCGPGADGWRNEDILHACSSTPSVDCALLAAHCRADVGAMREKVEELSHEVQETGDALLSDFSTISPPDDIALSHAHFLACLQARVAEAGRVVELARGEPLANPDHLPACQIFVSAEAEVRAYVGSW